MIYLTVGTQLPFDRLVSIVDQWAMHSGVEVLAQIGPSNKKYSYLNTFEFVSPLDAERYFDTADLIVAHAGMGSILSAMQRGKPIIVFPRRADLKEHRNDHQMATARRFKDRPGIYVAFEEQGLLDLLDQRASVHGSQIVSAYAADEFINEIKNLIES